MPFGKDLTPYYYPYRGDLIIKTAEREIYVLGQNHKITFEGNRVFMDTKEFRKGRWRFSFRAVYHMLFTKGGYAL